MPVKPGPVITEFNPMVRRPLILLLLAAPLATLALGQDASPSRPGNATELAHLPSRVIMTEDGWLIPPSLLEAGVDLERVTVPQATLDLVSQLDAPRWSDRVSAAQTLVEQETNTEQLYRVLIYHDPTPEQRYRLLRVLKSRLLTTPRGALGIRMNSIGPNGGIDISMLIPGMPAERVLRERDRIMSIDGQHLANRDDLINVVQNRRPGDVLMMLVHRPRHLNDGSLARDESGDVIYDPIEVQLRLGNADDLRDPNNPRARPASPVVNRRTSDARFAEANYVPRPLVLPRRDPVPPPPAKETNGAPDPVR